MSTTTPLAQTAITMGIRLTALGPISSTTKALILLLALLAGCVATEAHRETATSASGDDAPLRLGPDEVEAGWTALVEKRAKLSSQGPKAFDAPDLAARAFMQQRLAPGATELPMQQLAGERRRLIEREQVLASSYAQADEYSAPPGGIHKWRSLGPDNIGGRTRALVINPVNPSVMYAAGVAGGVWKSVDAGANWSPTDDFMANLAVVSLAMDPADPDVLYAGTGEGVYTHNIFLQGLGIFKTTDGGASWQQLPGTVSGVPSGAFHYVNKVVISPNDSQRVYAATRTGVWRSDDGGGSWTLKLANPTYLTASNNSNGCVVGATELVIRSDTNPDMLFTSFGTGQSDGLFRSFDGGDSWQAYIVPPNQGRTTIALAPSNEDIMYLLMSDNGSGGQFGSVLSVFRSDDGGDSFTVQLNPNSLTGPWLLSNLILATGCVPGGTYSQGWYDNIIAVDPVDPDVVWVGGIDMFRSDDGGQNFDIAAYWIFYTLSPPPPFQLHPDHHTIVFHPGYDGVGNQTMYVGNDGGIFRTQNARAATSQEDCPLPGSLPLPQIVWQPLNNGYGVTQFYHGDAAKDRDLYVAGAQDNGTNRVLSRNTPKAWKLIFGGDGGYVAIDPRDSQVLFVESQQLGNLHKSIDGGASFTSAVNGLTDTDGVFIPPVAMDQQNPDLLWTGGSRPWRSIDSAGLWTAVGPDFVGPDQLSAIAIAPSDSNTVYLGYNNGYVVRSSNALAPVPTWQIQSNGLYGGWVSSLAVDPTDSNTVYLTYSSYGVPHVLKSVDGGQSWANIDGLAFNGIPDIPAHWIAVRPCDSRQLYVGTELGVFASEDAGASWQPANPGLPHTVVESLDFQDDDTLAAFTFGRGMFLARLQPCGGLAERPLKVPLSIP